jgi:hypothetical protein
MEGRLKGWMPAGRLDQLAERRQQLSGLLLKLQAGHLRSLGESCHACVQHTREALCCLSNLRHASLHGCVRCAPGHSL